MAILTGFHEFEGLHWETGAVRNALAYQGAIAPHNGQPYSEALLMGVSGGATFGYFTFDYQGFDPIISLITRNTFDPLDTLCERLGIARTVMQTLSAEKGTVNLLNVLESGQPALVWADSLGLSYNALPPDAHNWDMQPVLVYGLESGQVYIADRSHRPLLVHADEFLHARGRVKKDKYRVISLGLPEERKLVPGVQKGLWQCIRLYTEMPPKGARHNFGFAAYQHWAEMLTNKRNPQGWMRFFPPGSRLYAALAGYDAFPGVIGWITSWGSGNGAERGMFADFLDEAAIILQKPDLHESARIFRESQAEWLELAQIILPDEVAPLGKARQLLERRRGLFLDQGQAALDEILNINQQLRELRASAGKEFPLTESEVWGLFERMRAQVLQIHDVEFKAVESMQAALG